MRKLWLALIGIALVLSSCSTPQTPAPTEPPAPTSTAAPTLPPTPAPTAAPTLAPTATVEPSPTPDPVLFKDDFDSALQPGWQWTRENPKYWNLDKNPGWLEIINRTGYVTKNSQENILLREAPSGNFEIITRIKFKPGKNFQFAGLTIFEDKANFLAFGRAFCSYCIGDGFYMDLYKASKLDGSNFAKPAPQTDTVYLSLMKTRDMYQSFYSENGTDWTPIGTKKSDMKPAYVGLVSGQGTSAKIPSDFDYFIIKSLP
jgi:beta-xylosidase